MFKNLRPYVIFEFCFSKDPCFFYATFFLICFHRSPPQFLLETKRFASTKDCSSFSALCDLPETFIKKFRKIFSSAFCFLKGFRLRKISFLLFPAGEEWFSRFVLLPLVLRMILLIWFSSKVRTFLRACLRSTASPLCQTYSSV